MAGVNIQNLPTDPEFVRFKHGIGQRYIVTVDAEEEFDWRAPLGRDGHGLETVPRLRKFQQFCEGFGVVPVYLLDYPVASSPDAVAVLAEAVRAGRAEVGIQLHPWVNPPFDEELNDRNSFAGNLPVELERAKFKLLRDTIAENFGTDPVIYRAGRYGVGPNTADMLSEFGVAIDTSVRARFDYAYQGGPNYRDHPLKPYWIDRAKGLLELPLTTIYWGPLRQLGNWIYPNLWRIPSMRGVLAKLGLLERIPLTPEGVNAAEAVRGIDIAVDDGLPVIVLSFHSPSIAPGHTPYVNSEDDLDHFYDWWRAIFSYMEKRGVKPTSVKGVLDSVDLA